MQKSGFICLVFLLSPKNILAQISLVNVDDAVAIALKNNPIAAKNAAEIARAKLLLPTAKTLPSTDFFIETPQFLMGPDNSTIFTQIGAQQRFQGKKRIAANTDVLTKKIGVAEATTASDVYNITRETHFLYENCLFLKEKVGFLRKQDTVFQELVKVANIEAQVGKISGFQKSQILLEYAKFSQILRGGILELENSHKILSEYLKTDEIVLLEPFSKRTIQNFGAERLPILQLSAQNTALAKAEALQRQIDFSAPTYTVALTQPIFNQYVAPVVRVGVALPLQTKTAKILQNAANLTAEIGQKEAESLAFDIKIARQKAMNLYQEAAQNLDFYEKNLLPQAENILKAAQIERQAGNISGFEYLTAIQKGYEIKIQYLAVLKVYNETVLAVNFP